MKSTIIVRTLPLCAYQETHQAMIRLSRDRDIETPDEIWFLEHPPVFTLGQAGRREHILDPGTIPVIQSDRGGQVTYHGPGQLLCYLLLDLKRKGITVKSLVTHMEQSIIDMLAEQGLTASRRAGAPGVYIDGRKIAALGVRVRRGSCYHGLALNVSMNTDPFLCINPCGFPGLRVTQLREYGSTMTVTQAAEALLPQLLHHLGYSGYNVIRLEGLANPQSVSLAS